VDRLTYMKWMRILAKYVVGLALCLVLFVVCLIGYINWIIPEDRRGCSPDSEAAKYTRSLSQTRLQRLYTDMKRYHDLGKGGNIEYMALPEFSDLEVRTIRPLIALIKVEGCFDNYMYMRFQGVSNKKEPGIYLTCGEFGDECGYELLWPE